MPPRASKTCLLRIARGAGVAGLLWLGAGPAAAQSGDAGFPPADVSFVAGGILDIKGAVVGGTLPRVDAVLAAHPGAVAAIRIWSGGGTLDGAQRLARTVNRLGVPIRVEAGALCSSACVILLAEVQPRLRVIDPKAWLRVHGLSERPPGAPKEAGAAAMEPWIKTLSANWLGFLRECRSEPLTRVAGLAMTWGEVQMLDASPRSVNCDSIAYRDKDWVSRTM